MIKHESYDVIIIGDGIAGLVATWVCLMHGMKTIVIGDSALRPTGKKATDTIESIYPGVVTLLDNIGIGWAFISHALGSYTHISNGKEKNSLNLHGAETWTGYHISKANLVSYLKSRLLKTDLCILEATVAELTKQTGRITGVKTRSGRTLMSKYIIDASGSKRIAGKQLKFSEKYYSPPLVVWTGISRFPETIPYESQTSYFTPSEKGWSWKAPLDSNLLSWTTLSSKRMLIF